MSASWSSSSNADRHQPTPSLAGGRFLALLTAQLIVVGLFFALSRQMFDLCLELVEQHSISVQRSQQITGAFKQTTEKSHRNLWKPAASKALSGFSTSQDQLGFSPIFLGGVRFMESTIRSSEKSNSPCRLKCAHVAAEPLRTASSSAVRRSSSFSWANSCER